MNTLVFDSSEYVVWWMSQRITDMTTPRQAKAIGILDGQTLIAGIAYYHDTPCNINIAVAAEPKTRWINKRNLEVCFGHVFYPPPMGLGKRRASTCVHSDNHRSLKFCDDVGFIQEGIFREFFPDGDAHMFGMLKSECPWIKADKL